MRQGKLGNAGRRSAKSFATPEGAQLACELLIGEKLKEGYAEVACASPDAFGRTFGAFLRLIQKGKRRESRPPSADALLNTIKAPDVRAFVEAWSAHEIKDIRFDELLLSDSDIGTGRVPEVGDLSLTNMRDDVFQFGTSSGGDLYALQKSGAEKLGVFRIDHNREWSEYKIANSLEAFIEQCAKRTQVDANPLTVIFEELTQERRALDPKSADKRDKALHTGKAAIVAVKAPPTPSKQDFRKTRTYASVAGEVLLDFEKPEARVKTASEEVVFDIPLKKYFGADLSIDGRKLIVANSSAVREVDLTTRQTRLLVRGYYFAGAKTLANGMVAVLTLSLQGAIADDPDATFFEQRQIGKCERDPRLAYSRSRLFLVDTKSELPVAREYPFGGSNLSVFGGGKFLVLRGPARGRTLKETHVFGVKSDQLVSLAKLKKDIGDVFEHEGRIYGSNGYELVGFEAALEKAKVKPEDRGSTPELTTEPLASPPARPPLNEKTRELFAGSWHAEEAVGPYVFGSIPAGNEWEAVIADESSADPQLRHFNPTFTERAFVHAFSDDASRCYVAAIKPSASIELVDPATGATSPFVSVYDERSLVGMACIDDIVAVMLKVEELSYAEHALKFYYVHKRREVEHSEIAVGAASVVFPLRGANALLCSAPRPLLGDADSLIVQKRNGVPTVVGRLPFAVKRAYSESNRYFVEDFSGCIRELFLPS